MHIFNHIHTHSLSLSHARSGVGKIVALVWLAYGYWCSIFRVCHMSQDIHTEHQRSNTHTIITPAQLSSPTPLCVCVVFVLSVCSRHLVRVCEGVCVCECVRERQRETETSCKTLAAWMA
jgi:hypothetical protein